MNLWQQNYDPAGNIWLSSLIFTCMVGVITTLQAYVLTWMIP